MPSPSSTSSLLIGLGLVACSAASSSIDAGSPRRTLLVIPPTIEAPFYETIVDTRAEAITVTYRPLTPEQVERDNAAKANKGRGPANVVVQDRGCANASLWLYDQLGGKGNRICFRDDGGPSDRAELYYFPRLWRANRFGTLQPYAYWDITYGTFYPGVNAGEITDADFQTDAAPGSFRMPWPSWGPMVSFDASPSRAMRLYLY